MLTRRANATPAPLRTIPVVDDARPCASYTDGAACTGGRNIARCAWNPWLKTCTDIRTEPTPRSSLLSASYLRKTSAKRARLDAMPSRSPPRSPRRSPPRSPPRSPRRSPPRSPPRRSRSPAAPPLPRVGVSPVHADQRQESQALRRLPRPPAQVRESEPVAPSLSWQKRDRRDALGPPDLDVAANADLDVGHQMSRLRGDDLADAKIAPMRVGTE